MPFGNLVIFGMMCIKQCDRVSMEQLNSKSLHWVYKLC